MNSRSTRFVLGAALLSLVAAPVSAQFQNCPSQGGRRVCQISTENASLTVVADDGRGPILQVESWLVSGVEQVKIEGIRVRDDQSGGFPNFDLFSAEIATDTNQILIFHELDRLGLSSIFGLRESEEGTTLDMEFFLGIGSGSASGQVFLVSDLDLDGDSTDAVVAQGGEGMPITQTSVTATQSLLTLVRGAPPTALDVGPASEFAPLLSNQLVTLDGTESFIGPGDLGSALAWQAQVTPDTPWQASLRRLLLVPEPGGALSVGVALLCVAVIARMRRFRAR